MAASYTSHRDLINICVNNNTLELTGILTLLSGLPFINFDISFKWTCNASWWFYFKCSAFMDRYSQSNPSLWVSVIFSDLFWIPYLRYRKKKENAAWKAEILQCSSTWDAIGWCFQSRPIQALHSFSLQWLAAAPKAGINECRTQFHFRTMVAKCIHIPLLSISTP